ncbi:hypothetical protein M9H77_01117 [Catharanthus roseus]|uniref:Uncharacterized protein n=1 Tax=Catharanthus roseus TaxID=4058 RepID=A0ACC0C4S3_CATRO|nr:hypothetical protein M9H77_01117 [Catharanthus roseus]
MRSIKIKFAYRFLRSLNNLNRRRRITDGESITTRRRRYHMVKTAAYASMASAVGSKRAWSRALLSKIRNNRRNYKIRRESSSSSSSVVVKVKKPIIQNPSKAEELEKLVPGGETMDFCSLLDETAHYIKCLTSQVQIMRSIVQFYESSSSSNDQRY